MNNLVAKYSNRINRPKIHMDKKNHYERNGDWGENDQVIYTVTNKTSIVHFRSMNSAKKYLSKFPPSVAGGMTISRNYFFSEILDEIN